jgi:hypothetical protein
MTTIDSLLHLPACSYKHFAHIVSKALMNPEHEISQRMARLHGLKEK